MNDSPEHSKPDAVAPPTFPQTLSFWRTWQDRPRAGGGGGRDMRRVLHGEQEFEYVRPLRAGDVLTATSKIVDEYEKEGKRGGTMRFVVSETQFRDQKGEIIAYSHGTSIVTSKATTE